MSENAYAVKDRLWSLVHEPDTEKLLANCEEVCAALRLTLGFWVELNYAYKGKEIANGIRSRCDALLSHCHHHKRILRIGRIRDSAIEIAGIYHQAHQEYMMAGTR